jgi:hypothetical protein
VQAFLLNISLPKDVARVRLSLPWISVDHLRSMVLVLLRMFWKLSEAIAHPSGVGIRFLFSSELEKLREV